MSNKKHSLYGFYLPGMKPSDFMPDFQMITKEEYERWQRDLEKEKQGLSDFEYGWGIGICEY